ncbi:MAG TPA: hypothetical protein EYP10_05765, partial [Armatimonadetes bacterium]|nr:hypothetical protein [Armatimonadota bacterium]
PQNPNRVYYASGFGIWRSDDGGRTWRAKSRNLETASVNALVAHPVKSGTLYVGYGERGVFKSEDAGRAMKHLPVSIGFPSSIAIGVDASKRTIIYAGGEGHIWRSDDDGSRWTKLLSIKGGAVAIGIFARNPNIVYTAISGVPYMYVSTDGGVTWRKWKVDIIEPTAVVVHPTSPQVVYIRDRKRGVFKSSDGGRTWQRCNHGLPQTDHNFSRAPLAIDINDPRRLYTGYIDGLFASDDGGKSWRCIFGKIFAKGIAIDVRTSAIYVTNGAHLWRGWWVEGAPPPGVYRSDDGGRTWVRLSDDGLVNPELGLIALDCAFNGTVYVGTIGNGVFAGERMAR